MPKSDAYLFVGDRLHDGRPARHLGYDGIPDRDLSPDDVAGLSDEQLAKIEAHPDLYKGVTERTYKQHNPEVEREVRRVRTLDAPVETSEEPDDAEPDESIRAETPAAEGQGE